MNPSLPFEPEGLYRAQIEPTYRDFPERTVFVSATSEEGARSRIVAGLAGFERLDPESAVERISNLKSARRCLQEGRNEDEAFRIFELRQTTAGPVLAEHPIFMMVQPGKFGRLWARAMGLGPTAPNAGAPISPTVGRLCGESLTSALLSTGERDVWMTGRLGERLAEELRKRGLAVVPIELLPR
jgi:hypothetical protein